MNNEYDIEAARKAISQKQLQDIEKRMRLHQHNDCIEKVMLYGLPYRVLWDYEQARQQRDYMEIELNPFYPLPMIPKQEENNAEYKPQWDLITAQGIRAWERLFTRFLVPYKESIATWKIFDLWGNKEHTAEETEQKKKYYIGLILDYEKNSDQYETKPRYKQLQDYSLYNLYNDYGVGYMWQDDFMNEIPPKHPQALQIMQKEYELEVKRLEMLNTPIWEIKHPNSYSKLYRINNIIKNLE